MVTVHFYEKPGCINNSKQKELLANAGCLLVIYDILNQSWISDKAKLRSFFGDMPVVDWFNRSAPSIKSGMVIPELLNEVQAIELMVNDPLLIRRPLIEINGQRRAGFDGEQIQNWLNLNLALPASDLDTCPKLNSREASDG